MLTQASEYYTALGQYPFPVMQLIWPDLQGVLPGDAGVDLSMMELQQDLSIPAEEGFNHF
jgi:hypothetical protein